MTGMMSGYGGFMGGERPEMPEDGFEYGEMLEGEDKDSTVFNGENCMFSQIKEVE